MKKAKFTLKIVLMSLVSLLLLTSMLLSTMLGSVHAALNKSFSKKLDFEAVPDLEYSYYLKDANNSNGIISSYKNTRNIQQPIKTFSETSKTIYQIKIPVTEIGFYSLSFKVDFWKGTSETEEIYVRNLDAPVGCQVLHPTHLDFASGNTFSISPDNTSRGDYNYGVKRSYSAQKLLDAYNHYQWKTLAPSRGENVDLTFSVVQSDIGKGYVVWTWDFTGLSASNEYTLNLTDISVTKSELSDANDPYIEFMKTQYLNNAINPTGVDKSGYLRYNRARGTYVTNATYDSMTMQISPLYESWNNGFKTGQDGAAHENVVVLNIPMKNIKKNVSYRVSFDFSYARQGENNLPESSSSVSGSYNNGSVSESDVKYSTNYNKMLNDCKYGKTLNFQSYIHNGTVQGRTIEDQTNGRSQITMANKQHPAHEVTRYDEMKKIASSSSANTTVVYTTQRLTSSMTHADALNCGYTQSVNSNDGYGLGVNWMNAIRHTEVNGDNKINWLTFYNTSFTFNISTNENDVTVDENGYCNNLFWTWAIDAFEQTAWFRVKIENVRIEEIVQYGSTIDAQGITIGNTVCTDYCPNGADTVLKDETIVKNTFRNSNGSGQNYQGRGYISDDVPLQSAINTFGTIYDAGNHKINGDYTIKLSGYCVLDSGVEKYVWSADGGKTWNDMTLTPSASNSTFLATSDMLTEAEYRVDSCILGIDDLSTKASYIDFSANPDATDSNFQGFALSADLSEYQYQHNLDIVFAAVPRSNPFLRCEILRIINYNSTRNYRTFTDEFISDIRTLSGGNSNLLNAIHNTSDYSVNRSESENNFSKMYGLLADASTISNASGYARRTTFSHKYEDTRTLFTGMPVKNSMRIAGWAIVEDGVEKYMWSADYGKTWNEIGSNSELLDTGVDEDQKAWWYDNSTQVPSKLTVNSKFIAEIPLSEYIGSVVDIIFVAKPRGSDALAPVARIDNVAVFGEDGTFYTRVDSVTVGGNTVECTKQHIDGSYFHINGWKNLGLQATTVSSLEPYHVNIYQTRLYRNAVISVANGGEITMRGFIICHNGVEKYQYTLDGGTKWYDVSSSSSFTDAASDLLGVGQKVDSTFDSGDCGNGDFDGGLSLELPSNVTGNKDLYVVAVANTTKKLYPVLHLKLNIT